MTVLFHVTVDRYRTSSLMAQCPACRHVFLPLVELPVEPLFTTDVVAELVPFSSAEQLRDFVRRRHPDWTRHYRTVTYPDGRRRAIRLYSASQVQTLRAEAIRSTRAKQRRPACRVSEHAEADARVD